MRNPERLKWLLTALLYLLRKSVDVADLLVQRTNRSLHLLLSPQLNRLPLPLRLLALLLLLYLLRFLALLLWPLPL